MYDQTKLNRQGQTIVIKPTRGRGRPPLNPSKNPGNSSKKTEGGNEDSATRQSDFQIQKQESETIQHHTLRNQKMEKEQAINDALIKFSNKRRQIVYSAMDDNQCHRFEDFMQSGFNDKKLKGLI